MHEQNILNRPQALTLQKLGSQNTQVLQVNQPGNERLGSTPSFATAQHSVVTVSRSVGLSG